MLLTRLAPSPTGALHLGNARTFLANFLLARQNGWSILCRIDDIDGPRLKPGADRAALQDLEWLGISWDFGPVYQSSRSAVYDEAVKRLVASGKAYACVCSRSEVDQAASAPHAGDGAMVYPGTCRGRFASVEEAVARTGRRPCLRFGFESGGREWRFVDGFKGPVSINDQELGDFVIQKADGTPAYQLACAVDDWLDGVTHVVRGDDLVDSTPRQLALVEQLYPENADRGLPQYFHLPLVVGPDGRRLAKRHGDTRLATYRQAGRSAGEVLGLLARWLGMEGSGEVKGAEELVGRFELGRVPRSAVVYGGELG